MLSDCLFGSVNVFDVLIFSGALFHTLAASQLKLFFALVDLPASVRSPRVTLLVIFNYISIVLWILGCLNKGEREILLSIPYYKN